MADKDTRPAPTSATLSMAYRDIYRRASENTGRKSVLHGPGVKAGTELLAEVYADRDRLTAEAVHLRAAIDPALRECCQCCHSCGPSIPCDVVIETLGDSCAGACFCGAVDA